jgi:hypothetical protein
MAARAEHLFARDSELCYEYNKILSGGKWNHMMDQTHIGYTYWQQPAENKMPHIERIGLFPSPSPAMSLEGSAGYWPHDTNSAITETLDPWQKNSFSIELFNRGKEPYNFSINCDVPWLHVEPAEGTIEDQKRLEIHVDWSKAPKGISQVQCKISTNAGTDFNIRIPIFNPGNMKSGELKGFIESGGYISMEAEHYSRSIELSPFQWVCIPDLGRTLSGVTLFPVKRNELPPTQDNPHLEYDLNLYHASDIRVIVYVSPTQNFTGGEGLRYAVGFDNNKPEIVNIHADHSVAGWEKTVAENINKTSTKFSLEKPGKHILKFWMIDPGIVLQKIVVKTTNIGNSYLGPPESFHIDSISVIKKK